MNKHIHIPLEDLLTDPEVKSWVNDAIGVLTDCKQANRAEKPIGMWEMDFQSDEFGIIKIDLGVELLNQTVDTTQVRIGTGVLGIDSVKEEVYAEVNNGELKLLSPSLLETLSLKPLVQEAYDRCKAAKENGKVFKAK